MGGTAGIFRFYSAGALERVVNSQYKPGGLKNSVKQKLALKGNRIHMVQFGGPGVSRLKFNKEVLLPVWNYTPLFKPLRRAPP